MELDLGPEIAQLRAELAAVETRGVVAGAGIVITGQKVRPSGAARASRMFLLCRTDPEVEKHRGLSYVLIDFKDPGVQYRPIKQMSGAAEFWDLVETARERGKTADPLVWQRLGWAYTRVELMRYSGLRTLAQVAAGRPPGPEASVAKLFWSEYHKRLGERAMGLPKEPRVAG